MIVQDRQLTVTHQVEECLCILRMQLPVKGFAHALWVLDPLALIYDWLFTLWRFSKRRLAVFDSADAAASHIEALGELTVRLLLLLLLLCQLSDWLNCQRDLPARDELALLADRGSGLHLLLVLFKLARDYGFLAIVDVRKNRRENVGRRHNRMPARTHYSDKVKVV